MPCTCNHNSPDTEYPIALCIHCKCLEAEKSLPKKDFKVVDPVFKNDKPTGETIERTVKEITIVRGSKYDDIIGWTF